MTWGLTAVAGATLVSGYMGSQSASKASKQASAAQERSAQLGIEEQRRQFEAIQKALQPYQALGADSLAGLRALSGLEGSAAQQTAIGGIESSPMYQALVSQGENALLQRAAATGGLRGGNTQAALAQFRPALLNQAIQDQYARLGGFASLGQNAAVGAGNAGLQTGSSIANLLAQQGAAQAGNYLAQGNAQNQLWGMLPGAAYMGMQAYNQWKAPAPSGQSGVVQPGANAYMNFGGV